MEGSMIKYSKNFERDYDFYSKNLENFNFCGTLTPKHEAIPDGGLSAKECFYYIESQGVNKPCVEPKLLNSLLLCKAGVNFQIKQWAEGINEGTLFLFELSIKEWNRKDKELHDGWGIPYEPRVPIDKVLAWENNLPVYYDDIQSQYGMPDWVVSAVMNQSRKVRYEN